MYAEFFGLRELPFNNTPDPRFFYSTPDHEEALASLIYAVRERKGFVLLTGEIGAGKTLVSRLMIKRFGHDIAFANVNHAVHGARDLMESLCAEFELPCESGATNATLIRTLHDFLLAKFSRNIPVVLVLDEGQNLPVEAFEQLRMIGNLEADDAKLLQIVIVGQPELQNMFRSPALRQLRQRLFRSFHLPALDRAATEGYIRHRLAVAGASGADIFSPDAIHAVHGMTRGIPRLINTLCDNAMLSAYSADRRVINRDFLESVARQMTPDADRHGETPPAVRRAVRHADTPPQCPTTAASTSPPADSAASGAGQSLELAAARTVEIGERVNTVLARVEDVADRARKTERELEQREERLRRLLATIRSVAADLQPTLADLRLAVDSGKRERQLAAELLERLARGIESAGNAVADLHRAARRMRPETRERPTDSNAVVRTIARPGNPEWSRTLHDARASLTDLRDLVRSTPVSSPPLHAPRTPLVADLDDPRPPDGIAEGLEQLAGIMNGFRADR